MVILNLFPLLPPRDGLKVTKLKPLLTLDGEIKNKIRYRLLAKYKKPAFYEGDFFYLLGELDEKTPSVELEEDEYPFENLGTETLKGLSERSLSFIVGDAQKLHRKSVESWKRKLIEKFKLSFAGGRFGEVNLYPEVIKGVFKTGAQILLQLDFKLRLQPKLSVHELLERGLITLEELAQFRFKPKDFDGTTVLVAVRKADEFPEHFFKAKLRRSTRKISRIWWEKLLENPDLRRSTYLLEFERGYVYPAQIVYLSLTLEDLADEVDLSSITKKWKMSPKQRWELITDGLLPLFAKILKPYGLTLENKPAVGKGAVDYHREVVDADGRRAVITKNALRFLKDCTPFVKKNSLTLGLLVLDRGEKSLSLRKMRTELTRELIKFLRSKGLDISVREPLRLVGNAPQLKREFLKNFDHFEGCDLVLTFLDWDGGVSPNFVETGLYQLVKGKFLEKNVPTQMVLNTTAERWNDYILMNVAEQVLAKTGNVPYKLSRKLDGVDAFVGLDVSRLRKDKNTVNAGVFTKFFFSDGTFVRYYIQGSPTFGEKLTGEFVEKLFMKLVEYGLPEGSRVIIHRDGFVRKEERDYFVKYASAYGFHLELVEVIKRNNPRFFPSEGHRGGLKGYWYPFDGERAVVATYDAKVGTHQPILVKKVYGKLPLERVVSHILSFTLLNYSSFNPIRLPATVHYADKISTMVAKNLTPAKKEGDMMFWL